MFKFFKKVAWVLFCADIYFSFQGIRAFSGSLEFALTVSLFIGAAQWTVSEAILSRSLGGLMVLDRNQDGEVTLSEWVRWSILFLAIVVAYGLDVVTNLAAIDGEVLGRLPFTIAGDEVARGVPLWGAWSTSILICVTLCFSDEFIHSISDNRIAELERETPALKELAAEVEARLAEAGAFGDIILSTARERGVQRGQAYK
ncbi:MAG: hypothetical protein AAFY26_08245 [Cyanobacteria bacterium J06638_22]